MNIQNWLKIAVTATSLAGLPVMSAAQGVPVQDTQGFLQQLKEFQQMLTDAGLQSDQLDQLLEQARLLQEQMDRLTEIQGLLQDPAELLGLAMGDDLDGLLEGEFDSNIVGTILNGSRGDWSGLQGASAGIFKERVTAALEGGGTTQEQVEALANSGNAQAERNATATTSGAATSAAAEVAYDEATQSVKRVQMLVTDIGNMDSLKKSVDHNTRVTAELAIAMAAMWQLESVQTMNVGMTGVLDAATLADIEKFTDFTQPEFE